LSASRRQLPPLATPPASEARLLTTQFTKALYRIHPSAYGALHFGRSGDGRFDLPTGKYGVCYLGCHPECCLAETLLHQTPTTRLSWDDLATHTLSVLEPRKPLLLVDVTSTAGQVRASADGRLGSGDYLNQCQAYSQAFHENQAQPDGILYRPRHALQSRAVALFERARHKVKVASAHSLTNPEWLLWVLHNDSRTGG